MYPAWMRGDAYLHEHNGKAAAAEYRKLVGLWSGADAHVPVLEQARKEYARLG